MAAIERQIEALTKQLHELKSRQLQMNDEMILLEEQLKNIRTAAATPLSATAKMPQKDPFQQVGQQKKFYQQKHRFNINSKTEDFIGTNVISKIGILVTLIGVFIGAKYAIENDLISPLMRILAAYVAAAALVFVAVSMKKKYQYFSSVLIGGGLAITYFITYIAFSFYGLLPMWLAFLLMVITTGATVVIALWYNQKVIALTGQIAAYAIPFLLGDKSGNIFGLFAYISFINIGLLILSFKKDWKALYHIAFFLTWLIYFFGLVQRMQVTSNFAATLFFLTVNFLTFYITFLAYKIYRKAQYVFTEIGILLLNALFYFFAGIYLVDENFENIHFLTWFTVANAVIHFAAGYCIYRLKLADATVIKFISALGLLFVTVAIPIELDGSWVTLLWTAEATALFYIASVNRRTEYLGIALPLVIVAVLSLLHDWFYSYPYLQSLSAFAGFQSAPFANINFWLSLFVCACLGYISYTVEQKDFSGINSSASDFFHKIVPPAFLFILYFAFYNEIHFAWDKAIYQLKPNQSAVNIFPVCQSLTLLIYTVIYAAIWLFTNTELIKKEKNHHFLLLSAAIVNVALLTRGLYLSGELREFYLAGKSAITFSSLLFYRYVSFVALAILWMVAYRSVRIFKPGYSFYVAFSCLFNLTLLTIISNEFINWMDFAGYQNQYKLGLSLIGGGYALALIFAGIIRKKKHLRISAMILFGITLFKLFFYDLASLSTISKTIVLVLLGILLLFASFLYNKYKDLLAVKEGN